MKKRLKSLIVILVITFCCNAWGVEQTFNGNVSGNAATVTTNANLTGDITSIGNATTIKEAPAIKAVVLNPGTVDKITNGTMESGSPPTGWSPTTTAVPTRETTIKHSGSASLKITAGPSVRIYTETGTFTANKAYLFTGWVYVPTGGTSAFFDLGTQAGGTEIAAAAGGTVTTLDTWVMVSYIYVPSASDFIYVTCNGNFTNAYFDDVSLVELPMTVNGSAYLTGNVRIVIPTYANNAAAIAGGLLPGQLYHVNTGVDPEPLYIVH